MKFMKLGSKPDQFQTDGKNVRFVASELASDIVISVGDFKFYLHKFPLLSKSGRLQKLVAGASHVHDNEIKIQEIPGGPSAFEICAKFCYGMVVTLNAYNVVAARCAAEYLEMTEAVDKGNIVYKIDVFLTTSIFRSWKDSIIVLQTTKAFLPWAEESKIVSLCLDAIATKASTDPLNVDWSYTYNRKKLLSENGNEAQWNGVKKQLAVPKDWWVEDICELQIDSYKRVITTIRAQEKVSADVVGESLRSYVARKLPSFREGAEHVDNLAKYVCFVETITWLLPEERSCVPCSLLLKLLQASIIVECGLNVRRELVQRTARHLEEVSVGDLLQYSKSGQTDECNIDLVQDLVEQYALQKLKLDASDSKVAKLIDGYLAEAARNSFLPLSKFIDLAEMVSKFERSTHDGIYRAIDMYLKEHPGLTKSEKRKLRALMDCSRLSTEACAHAVQNERLPLRIVVQILFFQQATAPAPASCLSGRIRTLASYGSSSSATTTNTDEDWDCNPTVSEELEVLKGEFAALRLRNGLTGEGDTKMEGGKPGDYKVKQIFSKLWVSKDKQGESSSCDTSSDSKASTSASRNARKSS